MIKKLCSLLGTAVFILTVLFNQTLHAENLTVEAETLSKKGDWVDKGSFLLGGKIGSEASGTFQIPEEKETFLWVYAMTHGGDFRKTILTVNGKKMGEFGDERLAPGEKPGWRWIKASGKIRLQKGENTIHLKAKSDYARIDKIIFSDDPAFLPGKKDEKSAKLPDIYEQGKKLAGIFPLPVSRKGGPKMLVLAGGRPWLGNSVGRAFIAAGGDVRLLNSIFLAGEGGSFIRQLPSAKFEPKPLDGITWEFRDLSPYSIIVINSIPAENQERIFTPERVEKLRSFVRDGGTLIATLNIPAKLGDLLPVELKSSEKSKNGCFAERPSGKIFAFLPEKWEIFDPFREAVARKNAKVLSRILDPSGKPVGIYAAIHSYGKGKVLFLNTQYSRSEKAYQFFNWAYGRAFLVAITAEASGKKLNPEKAISRPPEWDKPKTIGQLSMTLNPAPRMKLKDKIGKIEIKENEIRFSDGFRILVGPNAMDFFQPGENKPFISGMEPPKVMYRGQQVKIEDSSAEAVNIKQTDKIVSGIWTLAGIKSADDGKSVLISWKKENGSLLDWEFKTGELNLDGKIYHGFSERVHIRKSPVTVSMVRVDLKLNLDGRKARRMSCYMPPRGYAEYDLSGKSTVDTHDWNFFASGQPFVWAEGAKEIYAGFIEKPQGTAARLRMNSGDKAVSCEIKRTLGRREAPVSTEYFWHMTTKGKASDNANDWMAMYQFQRHHLRKVVGFPEIPAMPTATYTNTCNQQEKEKVVANAGKLGFHFLMHPYCPSDLVDLTRPARMADFALVKKHGMKSYPWTPCGHSPGNSWILQKKDWFVVDEKGKVYTYFGGHFPVMDQNNPEYMKWYLSELDKMIDAGVGSLWFDMGGTSAEVINFAGKEALPGLIPLMKIYRRLYDRGQCAVTEGQNPLGIDGYLYSPDKYTPMRNREFAFFGTMPMGSSGLYFDFFRSSMYNTFHVLVLDSWGTSFEREPGELKKLEKTVYYLPAVNAAIHATGMPFIRETPFGTSWISDKGGALFFFDGVDNFRMKMPEGYYAAAMTGPEGGMKKINGILPKKIKPGTIVILEKNKK